MNYFKKSQSLLEMSIFGTLFLTLIAYILSYTQKLNEQQYVAQEAFRRALVKASEATDGSASYTLFANKRLASVSNPLRGDRGQTSGSATVVWGYDPDAEEQTEAGYAYYWYRFNEDEVEIALPETEEDEPDEEGNSVFSVAEEDEIDEIEIDASTVAPTDITSITHNKGATTSFQSSSYQDTVTYTLKDPGGGTIYTITQGIGNDGKYRSADVGNYYEPAPRSWSVSK